ncbi:MAG TPA: VCBS repeat-containing protein, partial [Thermoanaerobaculia bacterium]|nr:VCBS repeat-containing protein [Thermoanaerobaculia bacterium]
SSRMEGIDELVEVMTVVPYLLDRREVRVYLGKADGSYAPSGPALPLPLSVLSMEAGPPGTPVVVLTDDGVSALRLEASGAPRLEPLITDPPVFASSGNFLPDLGLVRDVDGDRTLDLLLPARDGLAIYLGGPDGLSRTAASRVTLPGEEYRADEGLRRMYPLPVVQDVDGDRKPDLVFKDPRKSWRHVRVMRNAGGGRFLASFDAVREEEKEKTEAKAGENKAEEKKEPVPQIVWLGDLDGDGTGELVTQTALEPEKDGLRAGMQQARENRSRVHLRHLDRELAPAPDTYHSFETLGYGFESKDSEFNLPGGFQDLNGDGRLDLVLVTIDITMMKALGVLATKRLNLGLDFQVYCQKADGGFRTVSGLDLSGQFRINLNDLRVRDLSLFSGDFNGDGRADFVQLGRGKNVTVHYGRQDCSFPTQPDRKIRLEGEPRDLTLVRIRDFNGDGRSDLLVVHPRTAKDRDPGLAPPVRLEFHLSDKGGTR